MIKHFSIILAISFCGVSYGQQTKSYSLIDSAIKQHGQYIDYTILPEQKNVRFLAIKEKKDFEDIMSIYKAQSVSVDYEKFRTVSDSVYGNLVNISKVSVYQLSNQLYAIDQYVEDKANPFYICESLADFKLIFKYLLVYRPELDWPYQVECRLSDHFEIKNFLEQQKMNLKFVPEMSNHGYKLFLAADGKCVYFKQTDNSKAHRQKEYVKKVNEMIKPFRRHNLDNEEVIFWSLVIYESIDNFKMHNVDLHDK